MSEPSALQTQFVRDLQKQLHLSDGVLERHCFERFGLNFRDLDRKEVSTLIDELKSWKAVPRELQIVAGQVEMFR